MEKQRLIKMGDLEQRFLLKGPWRNSEKNRHGTGFNGENRSCPKEKAVFE